MSKRRLNKSRGTTRLSRATDLSQLDSILYIDERNREEMSKNSRSTSIYKRDKRSMVMPKSSGKLIPQLTPTVNKMSPINPYYVLNQVSKSRSVKRKLKEDITFNSSKKIFRSYDNQANENQKKRKIKQKIQKLNSDLKLNKLIRGIKGKSRPKPSGTKTNINASPLSLSNKMGRNISMDQITTVNVKDERKGLMNQYNRISYRNSKAQVRRNKGKRKQKVARKKGTTLSNSQDNKPKSRRYHRQGSVNNYRLISQNSDDNVSSKNKSSQMDFERHMIRKSDYSRRNNMGYDLMRSEEEDACDTISFGKRKKPRNASKKKRARVRVRRNFSRWDNSTPRVSEDGSQMISLKPSYLEKGKEKSNDEYGAFAKHFKNKKR
jgi:hypothetical protein